MASWFNQVLIQYLDASGKEATNFWSLADQTSAVPGALADLAAAVQACSNAAVKAVQLQTTLHLASDPVAAPYQSVQDVVHILGKYGSRTAAYDLHSPKSEIFRADNTTLDLSNPLVDDLRGAMLAVLGTPGGEPLTAILRGSRQWSGKR